MTATGFEGADRMARCRRKIGEAQAKIKQRVDIGRITMHPLRRKEGLDKE